MLTQHLPLVLTISILCAIGSAHASNIGPHRLKSTPSSPDNWLGGTGNWSDGADWSAGLPGSNSDVIINTGNDDVILDTSANIQSLALGGTSGFNTSVLEGNLTPQTLNIAGALTINQSGYLELKNDMINVGGNSISAGGILIDHGSALKIAGNMENSGQFQMTAFGSGGDTLTVGGTFTNDHGATFLIVGPNDVANLGSLVNGGDSLVNTGATLNLTNQPNGITDISAGSEFELRGTFNAGGKNGLANLQSVEGFLLLETGNTTVVAPGNGTLALNTGGSIVLDAASTLQVNGNLTISNYANIFTSDVSPGGGNAININGTLTIYPYGSLQMGTYGFDNAVVTKGIVNNGTLNLEQASLTTPMLTNGGFTYLQLNSFMIVGQAGLHMPTSAGYHQLANGILGEVITPDYFGYIQSPYAYLDGTLDILLQSGFNPTPGTTYKFFLLQPGGLSGEFATVENDYFNGGSEYWALDYNNAQGFVELVAESASTPEPSSILLFGSGLLGIAAVLRRKGRT